MRVLLIGANGMLGKDIVQEWKDDELIPATARDADIRSYEQVERLITAERLVIELEDAFAAAGGPPKVLRMDNGPELVSAALERFCENKVGLSYIPPDNRGTTATSNRSTTASELPVLGAIVLGV